MIRLLVNRRIPAGSWQSWIFQPDPNGLATALDAAALVGRDAGEVDAFTRTVSSIRVGKIHKLTRPRRLSDTTRALARELAQLDREQIEFLDVGGSDGTTTRDAVLALSEALGKTVNATLLDRYVCLQRRRDGCLREYCTSDGSPVLLRFGPLGLQLSSVESTRDPLARWLGRAYLRRRRRRGLPSLERTFSLIHPAVAADRRVRIVEWNALERNPDLCGRFDAARASNFLNLNYFSRHEIERILSHLHAYLVSGGQLAVSRNHRDRGIESEHGSIWRRTDAGFERAADVGSGSYVAPIVDAFRVGEGC